MPSVDVTFDLPAKIITGLSDGTFVRNGGVIQDKLGRVVMWLRETPGLDVQPIPEPTSLASQSLSFIGATSALTLGVSILGFAVIHNKIKALEGRLQEVQKGLEIIDQKIDLSFYANFRAALDLARNSFSMSDKENRHNSALQAINRFLEAEHVYTDLLEQELDKGSSVCGDYILTLCLAYLAEVRCYLELGEYETALRRFQESYPQISQYVSSYVDILLTDSPVIYLHPSLKDSISLSRLTKIYQWKDASLNENEVFEIIRPSLFGPIGSSFEEKVKALPSAVIEPWRVKKGFWGVSEEQNGQGRKAAASLRRVKKGLWGVSDEGMKAVFERLPHAVGEMERMIETFGRFSSYKYELALVSKTPVTFRQWEGLKPKQLNPGNAELMYIVPANPISLELNS